MLKVTPSRIPLNKLKTKNRKNMFKILRGKKTKSKTLRYTKITFTTGLKIVRLSLQQQKLYMFLSPMLYMCIKFCYRLLNDSRLILTTLFPESSPICPSLWKSRRGPLERGWNFVLGVAYSPLVNGRCHFLTIDATIGNQ